MTDLLQETLERNFELGFALFTTCLFGTANHDESLQVFARYYDANKDTLCLNVGALSSLATVFVTEPVYANQYASGCADLIIAQRYRAALDNPLP